MSISMSHHQQNGVSIDISLLVQRFTRLSNDQFVHDKFTFESFLWLPWSVLKDVSKQLELLFPFFLGIIICYVLNALEKTSTMPKLSWKPWFLKHSAGVLARPLVIRSHQGPKRCELFGLESSFRVDSEKNIINIWISWTEILKTT